MVNLDAVASNPGFHAVVFDQGAVANTLRLFAIPPTPFSTNPAQLTFPCTSANEMHPASVSVCPILPLMCPCINPSEVVVGGRNCATPSSFGHSYLEKISAGGNAIFCLRHASLSSTPGPNLETDAVNLPGQSDMYAIQYDITQCTPSNPRKFWWIERECGPTSPKALPDLPQTTFRAVDVAAVR